MTVGGGTVSPYILTDFKNDSTRFRLSIKMSEGSPVVETPPFFRIKVSNYLSIGEFKTGKLLSALSSDEVSHLSFKNRIFTEPSTLSMNPQYMGMTVEKDTWALGYSYPSLLFAAIGGEKHFAAIKLEEVGETSSSDFQIDWGKEKLSGLNWSFISGFSREIRWTGFSVKASSYIKGHSNGKSDPTFSVVSFLQGELGPLSLSLSSLYGTERKTSYAIVLNSDLGYSVEETLGSEPVYGMTSQARRVRLTTEFSYSGFEMKSVHTRTNATDNSLKSESQYRFKYSEKDITATFDATVSRTEKTGISSFSFSLDLKDAQVSFNGKKIRLVLSCSITADNLDFKITADQDRVLTMVLKYSKP